MKVLEYADLDVSRVRPAYAKVVEALERDDFRSAEVKKLASVSHGKYFRTKLDHASLAEGVAAPDLERDELNYRRGRDKTDKSLEIHKFFVNALYVAITRAIREVYLVEQDTEHLLFGLLNLRTEAEA